MVTREGAMVGILGLVLASCGGAAPEPVMAEKQAAVEEAAPPSEAAAPKLEAKARRAADAAGGRRGAAAPSAGDMESEDAPDEAEAVASRAWFPEAFLWLPREQTGADGQWTRTVGLPDTISSWRLLALAHTADGSAGGAVHVFRTDQPTAIEVSLPPWLTAGDSAELSAVVSHAGASPLVGTMVVRLSGAQDGTTSAPVRVEPGGRLAVPLRLAPTSAGPLVVEVSIAGVDALRKVLTVRPAGQIVQDDAAMVLTASATWTPEVPEGTVTARVLPGGIGVLREEMGRIGAGDGTWDGGYGWALSRRAGAMGAATDAALSGDAIRALKQRSWQRLLAATRSPSPVRAAHLLLALGAEDADPEVQGLITRLVDAVAEGQRGDGTVADQPHATLQAVIVSTALAGWALPPGAEVPRARAAAAIERLVPDVQDPFTAAVLVASGLLDPRDAEVLRAKVAEAVVVEHGVGRLDVPAGVVGVLGAPPSPEEVSVWAALALAGTESAPAFVAALLRGYDARYGFGAGPLDPVALSLVADALPPVMAPVTVRFDAGGAVQALVVDPTRGAVAELPVRGPVTVVVDPPLPGLALTLSHRREVGGAGAALPDAVGVDIAPPSLQAGVVGELRVVVRGLEGERTTVELGLPPGVSLVGNAGLSDLVVAGDRVRFTLGDLRGGELRPVALPVRADWRGALAAGPTEVDAGGRQGTVAGVVWTVR